MPTKNVSERRGLTSKLPENPGCSVETIPAAASHTLRCDPAFSLSCPSQIKTGPKVLGPFCGEKAPEPINTQSHSVQILFRSDNSGENRGWRLLYRATGNTASPLLGHTWLPCSALMGQWPRGEGEQAWGSSRDVAELPALPVSSLGPRQILFTDSVSHL